MAQAPSKTQISLRTPDDVIKGFDEIATILDRDRTWVMLRAFKLYLNGEGRDVLQDAAAIAALDRGEGIPLDQVMNELGTRIARTASKDVART